MGRFFIGNGEKWDVDLNGPKKNSPPAPLQEESTEKVKSTFRLKVNDG